MPCRAWGSHWPLIDWQRQVAETSAQYEKNQRLLLANGKLVSSFGGVEA